MIKILLVILLSFFFHIDCLIILPPYLKILLIGLFVRVFLPFSLYLYKETLTLWLCYSFVMLVFEIINVIYIYV